MTENSEDCEYETLFFDILEFLAEYEKLPCLWDRNHEFFKDRKERLKCEQILGDKLGIRDLRTLRRKIRSVRGTYNTEIRKIKHCLESEGEAYPPKLFWFSTADKFLRVTTDLPYHIFPPSSELAKNRKRKLLKNLPHNKGGNVFLVSTNQQMKEHEEDCKVTEEIDQEITNEETMQDYEEYEELQSFDELENSDHKSQDGASVKSDALEEFVLNDYDSSSSVSKFKTKSSQNPNLSAVVDYLKDIVSENEFIAFGRSVGVQLKNMPLDLAVQLQMDIQAHITKTRLEYLNQTQSLKSEN